MLSPVQTAIDNFLISRGLTEITDIVYDSREEIVQIFRDRRKGRMNITIDVADLASPMEVVERIANHSVVNGYAKNH